MSAHEIRHPLIRHKLGLMRRADISTKNFRELAQELGTLLTYEATKDLPLETHAIDGWSGVVEVEKIAGKKITVVPILRAGIGMLEGVLNLLPSAKVSAGLKDAPDAAPNIHAGNITARPQAMVI